MSDLVLRTTTRTRVEIFALTDALVAQARQMGERLRSEERGADVIEYVGMLIFAAIIVLAILVAANGLKGSIVSSIQRHVNDIINK